MQKLSNGKDQLSRLYLSIAMACIGILFLLTFLVNINSSSQPISINILPEIPKEGMPFLIKINLQNPSQDEDLLIYELYANGKLLTHGTALLSKTSREQLVYVYPESPPIGEKITLQLKAKSRQGEQEKIMSLPAYPPQIWSSFVSFASFSTSMMSSTMSITSVSFYDQSFGDNSTLNLGLTFSLILISMLIFLELTEPLVNKSFRIKGMRIRFSKLSTILFIVFMGMVLTKIVMILA
jgi:hypothetical protein